MLRNFIMINVLFAMMLWVFSSLASADEKKIQISDYNTAVIGHIITSKVNGTNVDISKLMESELEGLAHQFAIESITILQKYLPSILDGIAADMRLKADKKYKCELLKGSKIEDDNCI